jgi:hypothetical protein
LRASYGYESGPGQVDVGGKRLIKAVGLFSGGLDSTIALRVILEQGIPVTALHIRTGFSYAERERLAGREPVSGPSAVERAAAQLDVPLETLDLSQSRDYIGVVLDPRFGYGSGMNPCVDCRIFLLRQAKTWMEAHGHHFVFTGEVVGQRPKSQMRPTLEIVKRESGLEGYLVRPLSAKLLEPTIPEIRGWVDRERLYAISGRGRKEQIALAERFGITEYAQPSGGCCYLIDQSYSRRLRDFLAHKRPESLSPERVQLLAVGRHIRLDSGCKVVVGRHEGENAYLEMRDLDGLLLTTPDRPGPATLVLDDVTEGDIVLAGQITASYSDGKHEPAVHVEVRPTGKREGGVRRITVPPMSREQIHALMV